MVKTVQSDTEWYEWNGDSRPQPIVEFLPKRNTYDVFQNKSCTPISESKMACNSNVSLITDGPVSGYIIKYQHKGNQEEEAKEYANVEAAMKSMNG